MKQMFVVCFCQLMRKNPEKRLGSGANDSDEVMRQGFFKVCTIYTLWSMKRGP